MILDKISAPEDLKMIATEKLPDICAQLRNIIIDTVSKNGGHLAPSLGTVELTVAMHYVFDSPADKIVWDVGHQAYAHKILTGRRDTFHTLRTKGGVSGFPNMSESPHDVFGVGHASTSISAALGMAKAMKMKGSANRAIAVIGDGSMTGGLAFEALNQAGHKVGNLIVILNDNEMSISKNVGAVSKFLSTRIHGKTASKLRRHLKKLLLLIPLFGNILYQLAQRAEQTTVGFFTPGYLFEAFGFDYIGPIDGHNLEEMLKVFSNVRSEPIGDKPTLIHVMTKKGKGYQPAEENPTMFHGLGAFDKATGKTPPSEAVTFTKAFNSALCTVAKDNDKVVAITAAMMTGTGLEKFAKEYPNRFYDVGIAEGHAVTFAAGLATQGFHPVVAVYSTFLQRAFDNIVHDVCLQNLPVTFALDRAGVVGDDGATHHGVFDLSYLRMIPNLTIMAPRDGRVLYHMLEWATSYDKPTAIRYPRGTVPSEMVVEPSEYFECGKSEIVYQSEAPIATIFAVGHLVADALQAAKSLKEKGIQVNVIDPRFIKPIDERALAEAVAKTRLIITVEENVAIGGFGSAVSEWLAKENINDVTLRVLALPDKFVEHATQTELRETYGLNAKGIEESVISWPSLSIQEALPKSEKPSTWAM